MIWDEGKAQLALQVLNKKVAGIYCQPVKETTFVIVPLIDQRTVINGVGEMVVIRETLGGESRLVEYSDGHDPFETVCPHCFNDSPGYEPPQPTSLDSSVDVLPPEMVKGLELIAKGLDETTIDWDKVREQPTAQPTVLLKDKMAYGV